MAGLKHNRNRAVKGLDEQLQDVFAHLKKAGAAVPDVTEDADVDTVANARILFGLIGFAFKECDAFVIKGMVNAIATVLITADAELPVVEEFITAIVEAPAPSADKELAQLQTMYSVFHMLPEAHPSRPNVYVYMLDIACRRKTLASVPHDLDTVRGWLGVWNLAAISEQRVLRALHKGLVSNGDSEKASEVMLDLLQTYDDVQEMTSDDAKADCERCIVSELSSSAKFTFGHLMKLNVILAQKGTLIYQLLSMFVDGDLAQFDEFKSENSSFFSTVGLDESMCLQKIRLLTFASMAQRAENEQISFELIRDKLGLHEDEVEVFVIYALRSGIIKAKIDQANRRVLVSVALRRDFTMDDWKVLKTKLDAWRDNLSAVRNNVSSVHI